MTRHSAAAEALAAAAQAGREIGVLLLTDGEGSHPGSVSHDRERLVKLRREELDSALALLVPGKTLTVMRAGLEDGRSDLEQLASIAISGSSPVPSPLARNRYGRRGMAIRIAITHPPPRSGA